MRRAATAAVMALAVAPVCVLAPAPARADGPLPPLPPHAGDRLARVAAGLAKDPLFVDPDVAAGIDAAQHTRIEALIRAADRSLRVPVYVAVVPNPPESESQGKAEPFLWGVRDRLRRDGLYVLVDDGGYLSDLAFGVPRDVPEVPWALERPRDVHHGLADVADRLDRVLGQVRAAPSAPPRTPQVLESAAPFGQENPPPPRPAGPAIAGPFFAGLLLAGPLGALVLYGLYRLAGAGAGLARRTAAAAVHAPAATAGPAADPGAPARPSARWLRRTATTEVDRLHAALDAGTAGRSSAEPSTGPGDAGSGANAGGETPGRGLEQPGGLARRAAVPVPDARRRRGRGPVRAAGRAYALAAYDAAQILSDDVGADVGDDDAAPLLDLVGVIVLARLGRAALAAGTAHPAPPCFVNPLHGPGTERRPLPAAVPGRPPGRLPVCASCARASGARLAAAILSVPGASGPVPHYAVAGVWKTTGFGAHAADLPARVLEHLDVD